VYVYLRIKKGEAEFFPKKKKEQEFFLKERQLWRVTEAAAGY